MGKKDHRRYGSPFDPNFKGTGKTTVPPAAASAPNRKEAARLTMLEESGKLEGRTLQ